MKHRVVATSALSMESGEPLACYGQWRDALQLDEALLLVDFSLSTPWLGQMQQISLTAIYVVCDNRVRVAVTDQLLVADTSLSPQAQYQDWVSAHQLVDADPQAPLRLATQTIDKPWGQEIWYTGVERRGVCNFVAGKAVTPIPWLQAVLPDAVAGEPGQALVLLKILDPSPQPVLGDLYFELHEAKREAYVVTGINRQAWPDGIGYIRYGFDPLQIASCPSPEAFREEYLNAVTAYERQRRLLDTLTAEGKTPSSVQLATERQLREYMDSYTAMRPVQKGDVVQVPVLLPHALQHGVRVIEFQTPTYERKIVSFAQKVLTQDHWDSQEAVASMLLEPPGEPAPVHRPSPEGITIEQIVDFPDFEVERVTMVRGARWLAEASTTYRLLIVLEGELTLAGVAYAAEQAVLLPRQWQGELLASQAAPSLAFLLARPNC